MPLAAIWWAGDIPDPHTCLQIPDGDVVPRHGEDQGTTGRYGGDDQAPAVMERADTSAGAGTP